VLHTREGGVVIGPGHPIRPDSDYGTSKAFGEAIARQYFELHGISSICLRIGTVTEDDDPAADPTGRMLKTWLSHRDAVQLFRKSLETETEFGIYYGVSGNKGRFWDIENARQELGYLPVNDAAKRLNPE
jgi:nucleoside-diphosphate-sugar epimerase